MTSASAPASELAVQLPAPASSVAVPPPAASTAEAVDLSAGAAILEDPGPAAGADVVCLYLFVVAAASAAVHWYQCIGGGCVGVFFSLCLSHASSFHFLISLPLVLPFCFLVIFRRYFVCTYSYMGSASVMYEVL